MCLSIFLYPESVFTHQKITSGLEKVQIPGTHPRHKEPDSPMGPEIYILENLPYDIELFVD